MTHLYDDEKPLFPKEFNIFNFSTRGYMFEGIGLTQGTPAKLYRDYARVVTALDREIGRVLNKLDEMKIADNTIVIFASDNGFFWGEHQLGATGRWPYEESIRIPFIVRAPGLIKQPGKNADQMILNIDLAPSILEMAGIPVPEIMEGESFLPILRNNSVQGRKAWLYEYFKDFPYRPPTMNAVRTDTHIYIEYKSRRASELYNVTEDPRQLNNLMDKPEGKLLSKKLKKMMERLKKGKGFSP